MLRVIEQAVSIPQILKQFTDYWLQEMDWLPWLQQTPGVVWEGGGVPRGGGRNEVKWETIAHP